MIATPLGICHSGGTESSGRFSMILRVSYSTQIVIFHPADAWRRQLLPPEPRNVWRFSDISDQNFHSIENINIAPLPGAVDSNSINIFPRLQFNSYEPGLRRVKPHDFSYQYHDGRHCDSSVHHASVESPAYLTPSGLPCH
jgi:hypothetical protein